MASAIADCAFVASQLPVRLTIKLGSNVSAREVCPRKKQLWTQVSLSLEMHCSPKQQASEPRLLTAPMLASEPRLLVNPDCSQQLLANDLIHLLGASLLTYDELCAMGSVESLSPLVLTGRILCKGKVKAATKGKAKSRRSTKKVRTDIMTAIRGFAKRESSDRRTSAGESPGGSQRYSRSRRKLFAFGGMSNSIRRPTSSSDDELRQSDGELANSLRSMRDSSVRDDLTGQDASAREGSAPTLPRNDSLLEANPGERYAHSRATQMRQRTDELYAGILTMRSRPFKEFCRDKPLAWPLTISSVQEEMLLRAMGLSKHERDELEGLTDKRSMTADAAADPILSLAYCPPKETAKLQFLTATKLLRPCKELPYDPSRPQHCHSQCKGLTCWVSRSQTLWGFASAAQTWIRDHAGWRVLTLLR